MKKLILTSLLGFLGLYTAMAQIPITSGGYTQDFNTLATSGLSATLPTGWEISEVGFDSNVDGQYRGSNGTSGLFDTFSFGVDTDRALGSRRNFTNDIAIRYGALFVNNTGETITSFEVQYDCEQWSLGANNFFPDELTFEISSVATTIEDANGWVESINLTGRTRYPFELMAPEGDVFIGQFVDGNAIKTTVTGTATIDQPILPGETFYVRWTDANKFPNPLDTQDGLGIDNLSIIPVTDTPTDTEINFRDEGRSVNESEGFASILIDVTNPSATNAVNFDLVLIFGDPADLGNYTTQNITIPANNGGTDVTINITDNPDEEGDKLFVFQLQNITGGDNGMIGMDDLFELTVLEDDFDNLFYRTITNGTFSDPGIWESSTDSSNWNPATMAPDYQRNSIVISAADRIILDDARELDQVFVLGELVLNGAALTINDGPGTDLAIFNTFDHLTAFETVFEPGATARVKRVGGTSGKIVVTGTTGNPSIYGTSTAITYENIAELNWTVDAVPSSGTYFANTPDDGTTPVFRIRSVTGTIGADDLDFIVNGVFTIENNNSVTFGGTGTKVFRDGLGGAGDFTQQAGSGQIQITGSDALIGGSEGTYDLNDTQGMLIAAGSNTFVGGSSNKTFNGGKLTVDGTLDFLASDNRVFTFTHSGPGTVGLDGAGTIDLSGGDHIINIASESPTFASTFIPGTLSTVNFTSDDLQNIPAINFANLTSSGTGDRVLASTGEIGVASAFTPGVNSYTTTGSTINYNGTDQNVAAFDYSSLTASTSGTKSLSGTTTVSTYLTLADAVTFDANGQSLTLISTATETASLAAVPATASYVGEITTQRHIPAGILYRYISSPVNSPAVSQIQDDIPITGTFTGADDLPGWVDDPSFFFYDETLDGDFNNGFTAYPFADNSETLTNGLGYSIYIRRGAAASVLELTAAPNIGDIELPIEFTTMTGPDPDNDGWNLVGNPFPSAIDWAIEAGWTKTNIEDGVYVPDNEAGVFASYVDGIGVNGGTGRIASGQAFWVKAEANNSGLTVTEGAKSTLNDTEFFRINDSFNNLLRLTLSDGSRTDEIAIRLEENATAAYDQNFDALSVAGILPRLDDREIMSLASLSDDGRRLSINSQSTTGCKSIIPLSIMGKSGSNYVLDVKDMNDLPSYFIVELHDKKRNTFLTLKNGESIQLQLDSDVVNDRYEIVMTSTNVQPTLTFEDDVLVTDKENVVWSYNGIELDGVKGKEHTPLRSGTYTVQYSFGTCVSEASLDIVVPGKGFFSYFMVAPNPMESQLNLTSYDEFNGDSEISIMDVQGRVFLDESLVIERGLMTFDVSNLPSGVYILKIATENQIFTQRLMKQ